MPSNLISTCAMILDTDRVNIMRRWWVLGLMMVAVLWGGWKVVMAQEAVTCGSILGVYGLPNTDEQNADGKVNLLDWLRCMWPTSGGIGVQLIEGYPVRKCTGLGWFSPPFLPKDHTTFTYKNSSGLHEAVISIYRTTASCQRGSAGCEDRFGTGSSDNLSSWVYKGTILGSHTLSGNTPPGSPVVEPNPTDIINIWVPHVAPYDLQTGRFLKVAELQSKPMSQISYLMAFTEVNGIISGGTTFLGEQRIRLAINNSADPFNSSAWQVKPVVFTPTHAGADYPGGGLWSDCRDPYLLDDGTQGYLFYTGRDTDGGIVGYVTFNDVQSLLQGNYVDHGAMYKENGQKLVLPGQDIPESSIVFKYGDYWWLVYNHSPNSSPGGGIKIARGGSPTGPWTEPVLFDNSGGFAYESFEDPRVSSAGKPMVSYFEYSQWPTAGDIKMCGLEMVPTNTPTPTPTGGPTPAPQLLCNGEFTQDLSTCWNAQISAKSTINGHLGENDPYVILVGKTSGDTGTIVHTEPLYGPGGIGFWSKNVTNVAGSLVVKIYIESPPHWEPLKTINFSTDVIGWVFRTVNINDYHGGSKLFLAFEAHGNDNYVGVDGVTYVKYPNPTATPTMTPTPTPTPQPTPIPGAYKVYLPYILNNATADHGTTSFQVQNQGSQSTQVTARYYGQSGNQVAWQPSHTFDVAAGSSVSVYQPTVANLPNGFLGSVVVDAGQPIGAVVGEVFNWSGGGSGAAQYSGVDNANLGNRFYLPTVTKRFGGGQYSSEMIIQNTKSTTVNVTVRYYQGSNGGELTGASETRAIAGHGVVSLKQINNSQLPDGFFGGAMVSTGSGTDQIAVVVNGYNSEGRLTSYNGVKDGSSIVYAPSILRYVGSGRWTTSYQVMAVDAGTTNVTIRYYGDNGLVKTVRYDGTNGPPFNQYQSVSRFQGDGGPDTDLGSSWFGSLVVTANKKVILIVNQANYAGGLGASSYNGEGAGNTKLFLPSVNKNVGGGQYLSSFQIMNVGSGAAANLLVKYYSSGQASPMKTVSYSNSSGDALPQYRSLSRWLGSTTDKQPDGLDIPDGWAGSVVVESTNGVPLMVIAAQSGSQVNGDGATQYNGL